MSSTLDQEQALNGYNGFHFRNVAITFIILETIFVGLRYIARHVSKASLGLDDFFIAPAWLACVAFCGSAIALVDNGGAGHHILWLEANEPYMLINYAKLLIPFAILYALAAVLPKIAIIGLYLRIFRERSYRIISYTVLGILVSLALANILVTLMQCIPLSLAWNPMGHAGGRCINIAAFWKWASFPNILTDVVMLIIPIPCIWKLKLSTKEKIGVILSFCAGSVGLITSIVRFTLFFNTNSQVDNTYVATKLGSIGIAETGVYLIAACLPTCRGLFRSIRNQMSLPAESAQRSKGRNTSTLNSNKSFGNNTSAGFQRLESDRQAILSKGADGDASPNFGAYELGEQIRVHKGFSVSTTPL